MPDKEVICLFQMTAKKGKEEELLKALLALIPLTRKEAGCIAYELWIENKSKGSFTMYERFKSKQALDDHINSFYVQNFINTTYVDCVESHWGMDFNSYQ